MSVAIVILVTINLSSSINADERRLFPNTEPVSSGLPMPAQRAAATIELPDGFSASLFASEPAVQNPIAMAWDGRGRLWVAENYTYAERSQRFDLSLTDRVVIFDGTGEDSHTTRTVFTDDVQMLTGIEVVPDGVYLMCPPRLLFIPDADQDDTPDGPAVTVLDGFTVAKTNYHNFANGIRLGPDGWLYGRCGGSCPGRIGVPGTPDDQRLALEGGIWRYHPGRNLAEVLTTGTTNPWGHDWDRDGHLFFVNTVNGHLWHMIPGAHFTRPFTLDPNRLTYELIDFHADHWHFDTTGDWHESRDGAANSYGGGHAHSGTLIYNDEAWPSEYQNKLWTLNFHGRRINQERLVRRGCGFVGTHEDDFALMKDHWFRGMDLSVGPDGNVFVLDWSDAGECHEHDGVHRTSGRIFKIKYDAATPRRPVDARKLSRDELATAMVGNRQWLRREASKHWHWQAQGFGEIVGEPNGDLTTFDLTDWIQQPESDRVAAIRRWTQFWPIDDAMGPRWKSEGLRRRVRSECEPLMGTLVSIAGHDPSGLVRLTLASTLQRLPVSCRRELATALVERSGDAGDHNQPKMIWYGLIPLLQRPEDLVRVAERCRLPETLRLITRGLAEQIDDSPSGPLDRLLANRFDSPELRAAVLRGLVLGLRGRLRTAKPNHWSSFREQFAAGHPDIEALDVVFGDGRPAEELVAIVQGRVPSDDAARQAALRTLIEMDAPQARQVCLSQLSNAKLNVIAARGLAKYDDPQIAKTLVQRYRHFRSPTRPQLVSILVSRVRFATELLRAIERKRIDRSSLTAFDVRQIHSLGDDRLSEMAGRVWGEVRQTPADAAGRIESLKATLTPQRLAAADKSRGRVMFQSLCQTCHRLYGEGAAVGPDLTGAGRSNLDYLLTNILAPSAVVDKDYRLSVVMTDDGRVLNGLIVDRGPHAVRMQTATGVVTIGKDEIERERMTDQSPMPSGLLTNLSEHQVADLIAYLQHPTQVRLPGRKE